MWKLLRTYNQNRKQIWIVILIIVFIIIIIHSLNAIYKKQAEENTSNENTTEQKYEKQSKSLVSGTTVPDIYKEDFGNLIDSFLSYCTEHQPEKAYGLLSKDCKETLYPNVQIFKKQYYESKFSDEKKYSFQSWTAGTTYTYIVKIFNNMLATGMGSSDNYIRDYISIVKEDDDYKLNINEFVGKLNLNKEKELNGLSIRVDSSEIYMDYETANFTIKNNTEKTILLDSQKSTDSMYLTNNKELKYDAMGYELSEEDLTINPGEEKQISVKYSSPFNDDIRARKYVFSDIYMDKNDIYYGINNETITVDIMEE